MQLQVGGRKRRGVSWQSPASLKSSVVSFEG